MAEIIVFPGLIHFVYQSRKVSTSHVASEKTFRDFLKAKKLLISREGHFYRKGKEGVLLTKTYGQVTAWGKTKGFATISFTSHRRKEPV